MHEAVDADVEVHQPRLIALEHEVFLREFALFAALAMRHGKALVYILCGIAVYVFVIGLQILHGAAFGKLLLFLFGHLAGVVAAAQVVVMAVADEGEHHGIESPVFAAVGKRPQILRDHLAVAVEVVEPGLVVIPFEARHIF